MIFGHSFLELGGGDALGALLVAAPLDKEADGEAAEHAQHPDAIVTLDATTVVIVGDIQPLVEAVFDAPTAAIEL